MWRNGYGPLAAANGGANAKAGGPEKESHWNSEKCEMAAGGVAMILMWKGINYSDY